MRNVADAVEPTGKGRVKPDPTGAAAVTAASTAAAPWGTPQPIAEVAPWAGKPTNSPPTCRNRVAFGPSGLPTPAGPPTERVSSTRQGVIGW